MFTSLLKWFFTWLKPAFKRYIYPEPTIVELFMGTPGSLSFEITKNVIEYCEDLKYIQIVPFSDTPGHTPKIWINDETHGTCGLFAVCRYLGRLTQLHPSTPENALAVDGSLDLLQSCVSVLEEHTLGCDNTSEVYDLDGTVENPVKQDEIFESDSSEVDKTGKGEVYLRLLEARFEVTHGNWMELDNVSLADVCWFGTMKWLSARNILPSSTILTDEYPQLSKWFQRMKNEETCDNSDEETCDNSDEETCDEHKSK